MDLERGQTRLGVGEAEDPLHRGRPVQHQRVAADPEAQRDQDQHDGDERPEVDARPLAGHHVALHPAQGAGPRVAEEGEDQDQQHDRRRPRDRGGEDRHVEHVEREIAREDRVAHSPVRRLRREQRRNREAVGDLAPHEEPQQQRDHRDRRRHDDARELLQDLQVAEAFLHLNHQRAQHEPEIDE
jgi:hypothetical protein